MGTDRRKSGRSSLPSGSEEKAAKRARPNSETSQELFKKAQGGSEPGEDVQHHNYRCAAVSGSWQGLMFCIAGRGRRALEQPSARTQRR